MNVYRRTIFFTHFIIFIQALTTVRSAFSKTFAPGCACFFKKLGDISKYLPAF